MEFTVLTDTLTNIVTTFSAGYALLLPYINELTRYLLGIEVIFLGLFWALGGGENIVVVLKKVFFLMFWLWLIGDFPELAKAFVNSLISAGLVAGGESASNYKLLLDPSRIMGYGLDATAKLVEAQENIDWDMGKALIFGLCYLLIMIAFAIIAIQVFLAIAEFYLFMAITGILLPFGFLQSTRFISEKAIGIVIGCGVKLLVLSFLIAVIEPTINGNIKFTSEEVTYNEIFAVLLTASTMAFLTWKVPNLAASLLAGGPNLSFASAYRGLSGASRALSSHSSANKTMVKNSANLVSSTASGTKNVSSTDSGGTLSKASAATAGAVKGAGASLYKSTVTPLVGDRK